MLQEGILTYLEVCILYWPTENKEKHTWALKMTPSLTSAGCRAPHLSFQVDPVSQLSWIQGPSPGLSSWPRLWAQLDAGLLSAGCRAPHLSSQVDPVSQLSWMQGPSPGLSSWPRLSAQLGAGPLNWALKLTPSLISAGCRAPHLSSQVDPVSQLSWMQGASPELSSWPRLSAQLDTDPLSV
jgi:hypothetical protein